MNSTAVFVLLAQVQEILVVLVQVNTHVVFVTVVGGGREADVVDAFDRSREHTCREHTPVYLDQQPAVPVPCPVGCANDLQVCVSYRPVFGL